MKFNARKASLALPGVTGTARVGRRTTAVLPRLRPGDVAVIHHVDMDRDAATALVNAGAGAVVNVEPMLSGRYANLGPAVLAEAGVLLVDQIGVEGYDRIVDDQPVRVHHGVVYAVTGDGGGDVLATGRELDLDLVHSEMAEARSGLVVQVDTLTHSTGEFLRREQELLLNGLGLPELRTTMGGGPVVVVARAEHADLLAVREFVREQAPTMIAVGAAADDLLGMSWAPDVVVVTAGDPGSVPSTDALQVATDVVLLAPQGSSTAEQDALDLAGVTAHRVDSSATAEDIALLIADRQDAPLVVGVGLHARLEDFLDRQQAGAASTFATRLKVGSRLVDASAVRLLYTGRARMAHVVLVLLTGLVALAAAIAVTPVGQEWVSDSADYLGSLW